MKVEFIKNGFLKSKSSILKTHFHFQIELNKRSLLDIQF
jgi:hypothetical protein